MTDLPINAPSPRLCHIVKWPDFDGYGFNIHADKSRPGQYIGKVDDNSPADASGLREGDRIVEVNGVNISNENHKQVVQRIRAVSNETRLLVVDGEADRWYKTHNFVVRGDQANVITGTSQRAPPPDSPTPSAPSIGKVSSSNLNEEDTKSVESASSSHSEVSSLPQQDDNGNIKEKTHPEPIPPCTLEEELQSSDPEGDQCSLEAEKNQCPPEPEADQCIPQPEAEECAPEPVMEQCPSEPPIVEQCPSEPVVEQCPSEPVVEQCPSEPVVEQCPTEPVVEQCPSAEPVVEQCPTAEPVVEQCPSEPVMESCPSEPVVEQCPSELVVEQCPESRKESIPSDECDNVAEPKLDASRDEPTAEEGPTASGAAADRHSLSSSHVSSSESCGGTKPENGQTESLPDTQPEVEERKSPMSTTPSPPPSINPDGNVSNRSSPQNSLPPSNNGGLNLNMTAAEMRAHLARKKKFDPRKDTIDVKQKFHIVQNM